MRALAALVLGLAIGVLAAVTVLGAMRQEIRFDQALMGVLKHHDDAIARRLAGDDCQSARLAPRLRQMQSIAMDLETAFLPTQDDTRFRTDAENLRRAIADASSALGQSCAIVRERYASVSEACKACHQDFRR